MPIAGHFWLVLNPRSGGGEHVKQSQRKTLVVVAHPVADSFVGSLAKTVETARRDRGDEVRVLDLYASSFDPAMSLADWQAKADPTYAPVQHGEQVELLEWATSLVLVYPTWFGGFPAMLKGWIDRVWAAGVAYDLPPGGSRIQPRLRNIRELVVITSHGSAKHMNMLQGEPGKRLVKRGLRVMCHTLCRVRWVAFYGNDTCTDNDRRVFVQKVRVSMGSR
jgi:NAD(P)H dehydrogenase (quinone)